jgi:hypothetical protein
MQPSAHPGHQRRSNPEQYGFNVGCLEGVNPVDIPNVPTNDGVNHPADRRSDGDGDGVLCESQWCGGE